MAPDGPAAQSGLIYIGDIIVGVNGKLLSYFLDIVTAREFEAYDPTFTAIE